MSVFPSWAGPFDTFESCSLDNLFLNTAGVATIFFFFLDFVAFLRRILRFPSLLGQLWGFLSNVDVFRYGWDLLVHLSLIDWKIHFSVLRGFL